MSLLARLRAFALRHRAWLPRLTPEAMRAQERPLDDPGHGRAMDFLRKLTLKLRIHHGEN